MTKELSVGVRWAVQFVHTLTSVKSPEALRGAAQLEPLEEGGGAGGGGGRVHLLCGGGGAAHAHLALPGAGAADV